MKKFKNISTLFAILMVVTFAISLIALPNANAQTTATSKISTYPFVDALPDPAGVGQPVLINWGLLNFLSDYKDGWNVTLQITYPDGTVKNTTAKTWSTGTVGRKMSFMEPGNYTLQTFFDGETYNRANYQPSESEPINLEIIEGYWKEDHPGHNLPVEYWTRPVDTQLREWYTLMGSWLAPTVISRGNALLAPYNDAPESAHILWSMPLGDTPAGLSGGETGPIGFANGDAYEGKFADSIIIAGVLYYNRYVSSGPTQVICAVDLHTGKTVWEKNFAAERLPGRIGIGQIFNVITENNRGSWAYLWLVSGTTMYGINPTDGNLILNFTSVPSGTIYFGPSGEMLKYSITGNATAGYRLLQWNSTYVVIRGKEGSQSEAWGSQVQGRTYNAAYYDINVSVAGLSSSPGSIIAAFPGDRVCYSTSASLNGFTLTGINLNPDESVGSIMFNRPWTAPTEWRDGNITIGGIGQAGWCAAGNDPYIAAFWTKENRVNYVFSLDTGKFLFETEPQNFADGWSDTVTSFGPERIVALGKLYCASVSGIVYCYNGTTGEIVWTYEAKDIYTESYHRENWWLVPVALSDGKLYLGHMTHSSQVPIKRGAPFFALDAETGLVVWEIDGAFRQTRWGGRAIMGDSIIATMDTYDQQIYAIGKGPSSMTVTAPNVAISEGTTALISGTVMDISPGTQSDKMQLRFANGVPAVSEESQSDWMLYVYKSFDKPMDAKGVEVTVFAQQEGHERETIGTTTSDANGRFSITWEPTGVGTWDIYAYFGGSASYFGSYDKTELAVTAAPAAAPDPEPLPPYEWYVIGMGLAIIAVVIVIGLLILLKKK
ncbi:MAG: PQQ-binding-like beta-propeller repeat protein [Candidatus Bathyarchaeota archaeon]|nr:PQQ-binding-like beta-propeller repeat protein [Candidatus Termiticorpusculum sp.]